MIKKALQIGDIILPPNTSILEDYSVSESTIQNVTQDGATFIPSKSSGKEIVISSQYIANIEEMIPHFEGMKLTKNSYLTILKSLQNKVLDIISVGIDNRYYSIPVKVQRVNIDSDYVTGFTFSLVCYSEIHYWIDVTDFLFYSILHDGQLSPEVWNYDYKHTYTNNIVLDYRLACMKPVDYYTAELVLTNKKVIKYEQNSIFINHFSPCLVYIFVPSLNNLSIGINQSRFDASGGVFVADTDSFDAPMSISYYINNEVPTYELTSYVIIANKIT